MAQPKEEMRSTRRFALKLPLSVKLDHQQQQDVNAETKDVSSRGVFFYVDSNVTEGSAIEFTLTLPPEITLTESIRVHCSGHVVRVDHGENKPQVGIAAAIDHYDFENS